MKNPELYHKTIDILVKAYLNETLIHGDYCACAVGNMIAANTGITLIPNHYNDNFDWGNTKLTGYEWYGVIGRDGYEDLTDKLLESGEQLIKMTGYTIMDIDRIEKAFESCKNKITETPSDEHRYNGLMAVVEALDIIHENTDKVLTTEVKAKFQKA